MGRALLSLRELRGTRFPRIEKAFLLVFWDSLGVEFWSSQGKPGGDDGGLEARVGSSEKIACSSDEGLEFAIDDDGAKYAMLRLCGLPAVVSMQRDDFQGKKMLALIERVETRLELGARSAERANPHSRIAYMR